MNALRVTKRGLQFVQVSSARLNGFALRFNKRSRMSPVSGRANIVQEAGSTVFGVLYQLAQPHEIVKMDRFEYAPIDYRRLIVEVMANGHAVASWTYFANDRVVDNSLVPQRSYLKHLLAGREYLPEEYVFDLESVVCSDN
ncbi:MAG: gamma-glutamylcyclotransferase [Gammaproteobacteria bacterium]|nr:gamma-glutamylcyclotransferase [Gammaproteobacteria bacterium]